ncbi:hypothetical protein M513_07095 [Trichuris suis]|uniref:Uncharacterized protein n=1 Tax=Trichuris suis TaxID=68888 RepID=A0A085M417_9BILA|nr:hypothetical protein M513_07095 [Trichuris suis]
MKTYGRVPRTILMIESTTCKNFSDALIKKLTRATYGMHDNIMYLSVKNFQGVRANGALSSALIHLSTNRSLGAFGANDAPSLSPVSQ